MEEAAELGHYLPLSYKSPKEQEYVEFLWDAFQTNYTHGKYQFAFLAYHMLTMCFVYFNLWQIKQTKPNDFAMGLIGFGKEIEKKLLDATSPFVFSAERERTVLRLLKLLGCDNSQIGTYAKRPLLSSSTRRLDYLMRMIIMFGRVCQAFQNICSY